MKKKFYINGYRATEDAFAELEAFLKYKSGWSWYTPFVTPHDWGEDREIQFGYREETDDQKPLDEVVAILSERIDNWRGEEIYNIDFFYKKE